jgi:hypothetical protein
MYVSGDPLVTRAHTLAFGHNLRGRTELGKLETALFHQHPTAFASYTKGCRNQKFRAGDLWLWRESQPLLAFLIIRESSVGATRLRYVQSVMMHLARDYRLEGIKSLAIAPLGVSGEWDEIKLIIHTWLAHVTLPIIVYDHYLPGVQADESALLEV